MRDIEVHRTMDEFHVGATGQAMRSDYRVTATRLTPDGKWRRVDPDGNLGDPISDAEIADRMDNYRAMLAAYDERRAAGPDPRPPDIDGQGSLW